MASILVITRAKEREAAQPTEASRSSNQTLAAHIGGCLGRFREGGTASVLSQLVGVGPRRSEDRVKSVPPERESLLILRTRLFCDSG